MQFETHAHARMTPPCPSSDAAYAGSGTDLVCLSYKAPAAIQYNYTATYNGNQFTYQQSASNTVHYAGVTYTYPAYTSDLNIVLKMSQINSFTPTANVWVRNLFFQRVCCVLDGLKSSCLRSAFLKSALSHPRFPGKRYRHP